MGPERIQRKLTTILAADAAGYSRLMGADEEATARMFKAHRDAISGLVAAHAGRVFSGAGDSVMAEFASPVEAVRCAVQVQRDVEKRNAAFEEARRMRFRIGVNLGDVIIEGDDLIGDGVNVAARLQALAEPGSICISGKVYEEVRDRIDVPFEDKGEETVKNIARPVRVYLVRPNGHDAGTGSSIVSQAPRLEIPEKPSIAVLAFDNLSGDPEQDYFAEGIAEDIITALSKFRWFFVIARNSSFAYKGEAVPIGQVAHELGVRYVLEGSVRKASDRVRINVDLIDATKGNQLWAERYDRELADLFDLQDEMTETIIGALEPEIANAERVRARRKPPDSLDAWECYQRGLWHYWRFDRDDNREAESLFRRAFELDPEFAPPYAGLAYVFHNDVIHGWTDTPTETLHRGLRAAHRAVALDDGDAFAHCVLGRIFTDLGMIEMAIPELEIALELNSNFALAYYGLGFALVWAGRAEEALPNFHRVIRHSPRDPIEWTFEMMTGHAYMQLGEYGEAIKWQKKATRHANCGFWPHLHLAVARAELGRLDEARGALANAVQFRPDLSITTVSAMVSKLHPPFLGLFLDALRKAGLPE